MTDHEHEQIADGRRLRRERGRRAVIDAMIDLVLDGCAPPTAEQVIARAGVSQASLFRYFATLDELRHEAIGRYFERFDDMIAIPDIGDGPLPDRIERFVTARDAFYDRTSPMARLTRHQAADVSDFAETIDRVRSTFADQAAQHFAPELGRRDPAAREHLVAVIAALTSFEGWDQLATLGDEGRRVALRRAIADLLGAKGPPGTR
jgi:AcrR family transcriptional regulator